MTRLTPAKYAGLQNGDLVRPPRKWPWFAGVWAIVTALIVALFG